MYFAENPTKMEGSKLIALLRTFDSKELRAFAGFVQSPFFNKQEKVIHLFEYLKKLAPKGFPPAEL